MYGELSKCERLRELSIEDCDLGSEGLRTMFGQTQMGKQGQCKGFPSSIRILRCTGNKFTSTDIIKIIDKYPTLKIHTDGLAGEVVNTVRDAEAEIRLTGRELTPDETNLLNLLIVRRDCGAINTVDLSFNTAIGNRGIFEIPGVNIRESLPSLWDTLAGMRNLRTLWIAQTGLDDADEEVSGTVGGDDDWINALVNDVVGSDTIGGTTRRPCRMFERLVATLRDRTKFPKLGQLRLNSMQHAAQGKGQFQNEVSKRRIREAWRAAGRPEKWLGGPALDL